MPSKDVASAIDDAMAAVSTTNARLELPFDPKEVIDNLRLERYVGQSPKGSDLLRECYYSVRPFMTLDIRKSVQRWRARNWQNIPFPKWPVDTTVEDVCEKLMLLSMEARGVESVPFVWFWPKGARGCCVMTHDVETAAGMDFCDEVMNVDDAYGTKASFEVVPETRYEVSRAQVDRMWKRGFEVTIQDLNHDGRLFDNEKEFLKRAQTINRYAAQYGAKGFRAAVLYRKPEWLDALEFSYDMSIPTVAHLDPQRGGCCTVMPYFIGNKVELPVTTTQDYTLFHLLGERSIDLWKSQIDLILRKNGLLSFIIHPDYVIDRAVMELYKTLLGYLQRVRAEQDIWCALPSEVDAWWRARSKMNVEQVRGAWRVTGEASESAIVAYAKKVGGKLVYEVPEA
jgi:hypothetical protein